MTTPVSIPLAALLLTMLWPSAAAAQPEPPEGCFCIRDGDDPAAEVRRGCSRERFPSQFYWQAICRELAADGSVRVDPAVTLTKRWTILSADEADCRPCEVKPFLWLETGSRGDGPVNGSGGAGGGGGGGWGWGDGPSDRERRGWATRIFAGPEQFPPEEFAAYGIVAFPARTADEASIARHVAICRAWTATLPSAVTDEDALPDRSEQMATVWPVAADETADGLNGVDAPCEAAVAQYGLVQGLQALRDFETAGGSAAGNGPYLLAWSPSETKGARDAVILVADFSDVVTYAEAVTAFRAWRDDIERDPALWDDDGGWSIEELRVRIRRWADRFGPKVLGALNL